MTKKWIIILLSVISCFSFIVSLIPYPIPTGTRLSFASGGSYPGITYSIWLGRFLTISTSDGISLPGSFNVKYTARTTFLTINERKRLTEKIQRFQKEGLSSSDNMETGGVQVIFSTEGRNFSGSFTLNPKSDKGYVPQAQTNDLISEVMIELLKCGKPWPVYKGWRMYYKELGTPEKVYIHHPGTYVISLLKHKRMANAK